MSEQECCGSCKFWLYKTRMAVRGADTFVELGRCRASPPTPNGGDRWLWPETAAEDWCGGFVMAKNVAGAATDLPPELTPEVWLMACQRYARSAAWDAQLGPPPDKPNTRVPADIWAEALREKQ